MTSTIISIILFALLLVTLELSFRASRRHALELKVARFDTTVLAETLKVRTEEARSYSAEARSLGDQIVDLEQVTTGRITNLCEQLEDSRKGCRHYYDEDAAKGNRIAALEAQVAQQELAIFTFKYDQESARVVARRDSQTIYALRDQLRQEQKTNLMALHSATALEQENKLDAISEVLKTLMQQGKLCDAALASFGGRLSRAVQVYRKDRAKDIPQACVGADDFNPLVALLAVGRDKQETLMGSLGTF